MCRIVWLWFFLFCFLKCYTSLTCSNCTVQYTTIRGLGKWLLFGCNNVCLTSLRSFSFPSTSSQWVSVWPSFMYFVTKSGFLLGDSIWWVSNYELMVLYVEIHFELKRSFASVAVCRLSWQLDVCTSTAVFCNHLWWRTGQGLNKIIGFKLLLGNSNIGNYPLVVWYIENCEC